MSKPRIHNALELEALVLQMGFLPFFACNVLEFLQVHSDHSGADAVPECGILQRSMSFLRTGTMV